MILACDPGLHGAFAYTDGITLAVRDMPTREAIVSGKPRRAISEEGVANMLRSCRRNASILVIEQVNGMPGQSGPAAFTFGYGVGIVTGAAVALGYRIEKVAPSRWKGAMAVPADKNAARAKATTLWPGYGHLWLRKKDDGRAESAIMALYGWQVFGSEKCSS